MVMFKKQYDELATKVNDYLRITLDSMKKYPKIIFDSMEYSLFAGGKRLRPVMLLASHKLLEGDLEESLPLAGGLEMIHTYSLVHDDLPAMDNDDFRRGVPTNHKVFGEGIAILCGDALLNLAYETMIDNALRRPEKLINHLNAINTIAKAAGIRGMIGGQVVDLENEGKDIDPDILQYIHEHKTGALFMASLKASIMLEDPPENISKALLEYGKSLGLAFQIIDDILDVVGDDKKLGKMTGRDREKDKATYVDKYGLEKSWSIAKELCDNAIAQISIFGPEGEFFIQLANFIIDRHN
ncbi:MAG: polyprenyl synthetase family protein [Caldicoprobacterales bacterium]|jgi:geranylgeranyl diphosphate synthase type II